MEAEARQTRSEYAELLNIVLEGACLGKDTAYPSYSQGHMRIPRTALLSLPTSA